MFPAAEYFMEGSDTVAIPIVKQGDLIPPDNVAEWYSNIEITITLPK